MIILNLYAYLLIKSPRGEQYEMMKQNSEAIEYVFDRNYIASLV